MRVLSSCRSVWLRVVAVFAIAALVSSASVAAQWFPGQSVSWQRAQSGFNPGQGAIAGGPGNDPAPGTPMYVCRGQDGGSLVPGKWVRGNCNVAFNGSEDVLRRYEVAFGNAQWGPYQGNSQGLVQTGHEVDGSPLYSCRVHASGGFGMQDVGFQPGKLLGDGTCHYPLSGREVTGNPPFDVLYASGGGGYTPYPPYPQPAPLPGCFVTDPGVSLNSDGLWVGPNCAPSDGRGHAAGQPGAPPPSQAPPGPYQPGPSSVSWQQAQSPYTPGAGAIPGAAGKGSKANEPLYVCRAYFNSALLPGKWLSGQCSVSYGGKEQKMGSYEVATGPAEWRNFDGNVSALVPGGYDADGTPLYVCRAEFKFFGSKGDQPGRLENGKCLYPYAGTEQVSGTPFDALYNVFPAGRTEHGAASAGDAGAAGAAGPGAHGVLVSFLKGTAAAAGVVTVTNGATGKVVTEPLPANSSVTQCVLVLQQAAFEAGLQIQAVGDGSESGMRVFGASNQVNVTGASVSLTPY